MGGQSSQPILSDEFAAEIVEMSERFRVTATVIPSFVMGPVIQLLKFFGVEFVFNLEILSVFIMVCILMFVAKFKVTWIAADALVHVVQFIFSFLGMESRFPTSWTNLLKRLNLQDKLDADKIPYFVQCESCKTLYFPDQCWRNDDAEVAKVGKDKAVKYSMYCCTRPLVLERRICAATGVPMPLNSQLVRYPNILYQLPDILSRPDIYAALWSSLLYERAQTDPDTLGDVYDGRVWKEWRRMCVPNTDRLWFDTEGKIELAFALNVDGFQPSKSTYSVLGIYLVILNLPRSIRYRPENMILVALPPGPRGPAFDEHHRVLKPMVDELNLLYAGHSVLVKGAQQTVHAVLILVACDKPAAYGVLGCGCHTSYFGCSKCDYKFERVKGKINCPNFDIPSWTRKTVEDHRRYAAQWLNARSKDDQKEVVTQHGYLYSALLALPYFDTIRYHTFDPMHFFFLGVFKDFFQILCDAKVLNEAELHAMQMHADKLKCPKEVGRVPYKIWSKMSGFKADQWKTLVLIYFPFVLNGALARLTNVAERLKVQRLACLLTLMCRIICVRTITKAALQTYTTLMCEYYSVFRSLFPDRCKTNMHSALHLEECCLDYGPVYAFWLFSFEQYNGMISSIETNHLAMESTFLRKHFFNVAVKTWRSLRVSDVYSRDHVLCPTMTVGDFYNNLLDSEKFADARKLLERVLPASDEYFAANADDADDVDGIDPNTFSQAVVSLVGAVNIVNLMWYRDKPVAQLRQLTDFPMNAADLIANIDAQMKSLVEIGTSLKSIHLRTVKFAHSIYFLDDLYGSTRSRTDTRAHVLVSDGNRLTLLKQRFPALFARACGNDFLHPALVNGYVRVSAYVQRGVSVAWDTVERDFALVRFYNPHVDRLQWPFARVSEIWSDSFCLPQEDGVRGPNSAFVIPVASIKGKFVPGRFDFEFPLQPFKTDYAVVARRGAPRLISTLPMAVLLLPSKLLLGFR